MEEGGVEKAVWGIKKYLIEQEVRLSASFFFMAVTFFLEYEA